MYSVEQLTEASRMMVLARLCCDLYTIQPSILYIPVQRQIEVKPQNLRSILKGSRGYCVTNTSTRPERIPLERNGKGSYVWVVLNRASLLAMAECIGYPAVFLRETYEKVSARLHLRHGQRADSLRIGCGTVEYSLSTFFGL